MTITEQIRQKLKIVDEELGESRDMIGRHWHSRAMYAIDRARRILREICELGEDNDE